MADGLIKTDWKEGDVGEHATYGMVRVIGVKVIQHLTVVQVHSPLQKPLMVGSGELRESENVLIHKSRSVGMSWKGGI